MQILSYNQSADEFFVGLTAGEFDDVYARVALNGMSLSKYQEVKEEALLKNDAYCNMICEGCFSRRGGMIYACVIYVFWDYCSNAK